jgi:RHS repeat-associated protein
MIGKALFTILFWFMACIRLQASFPATNDVNLFLTVKNSSDQTIYAWVDGYDRWWGGTNNYFSTDPYPIEPGCSNWVVRYDTDYYLGLEIEWQLTVHFSDAAGIERSARKSDGYFETLDYYTEIPIATFTGHPDADPVNPQKGDAGRGEPYNVINGAAFRTDSDMAIPAKGLPLAFGRSYNSADSGSMEFGPGWRASTEWKLEVPATEQSILRVRDGEGRTFSFVKKGSAWFCDCDVRWRVSHGFNGAWELDGRDGGNRMIFAANGLWASTIDRANNSLTAARDNEGRLTNVLHSSGLSLDVAWTNNRIASVKGPEGLLSADYFYTPSGLLTAAVRRAASGESVSRHYQYDGSNTLTNVVNALGQTVTYAFVELPDGSRRCTDNAYGGGKAAANAAWDLDERTATITYPVSASSDRTEITHWLADVPRIDSVEMGGEKTTYYYDKNTLATTGLVWSAGVQTAAVSTVLDSSGRPTHSVFRLGSGPAYDSRTEWDSVLDVPRAEIDPMGWTTQVDWTNGVPTAIRQTNGLGGWIGTSFGYLNGMLHDITDPNGHKTSFWRDPRGNVTQVIPPVLPTLAISNDILGRPLCFTLPGDVYAPAREWAFEYDGFGRVVRTVDPDLLDTRRYYDTLGHMTGVVDRAGRYTAITYGTAGKPLRIERTVSDGGSNRTVSLDFDYNLQLEQTAVIDSLGRTVEARTTDAAGRVDSVTNIEGRVASVEYGVLGLPKEVTRFDGSLAVFDYDSGARLSKHSLPGRTNAYTWLANGLLASVTDGGIMVTNDWIAPGRLTAQEIRAPGWTGRVAYGCDLIGSVTQLVASGIGLTQAIGYDAGNRETSRESTCRSTFLSVAREYADWNGLPSRMTTGPLEQGFGWDRLDRLTNLTWRTQGAVVRSMDFSVDALGRITQRVDRAAGHATVRRYAYDDLDRLVSEAKNQEQGMTNVVVYSYDDAGRRTVKTSTAFDVQYENGTGDRLAGWSVTRTNTPSCTVSGFAGEIIGTDPRYGVREIQGGLHAIAPVINGSNFSAQVAFGSLGEKTIVATVSDAAGNNVAATNTFVLAAYTAGDCLYDEAGCVTQLVYRGAMDLLVRSLDWDSEYRLTAVSTNGVESETYGYDPLGRRIWTAAEGVTTRHLYDGPHVLADLDATGGVIRTYLYGPGLDELIAMTVHTGTVAKTYYAIRDHQNTIWAWVDERGSVVESYDFDAWGRMLGAFDSGGFEISGGESQIGNRYLWQGREYSWKTGLYYFRARWYDPVTGRWLSPDPIGISGGLNQYVFCGNDPVNNKDPFGLCEEGS